MAFQESQRAFECQIRCCHGILPVMQKRDTILRKIRYSCRMSILRPPKTRKAVLSNARARRTVTRNADAQRGKEISKEDENFAKLLNNGYIDGVDDRKKAITALVMEQYGVDSKTALKFANELHSSLTKESVARKHTKSDEVDIDKLELELKRLLNNPPLYRDRPTRSEKPTEFYKRVWHKFAHYGLFYQDQLREIDEQLINRVRHYCAVNHLKAASFLPPPRQARTQRDAAFGDPKAIARLVATERLRSYKPK